MPSIGRIARFGLIVTVVLFAGTAQAGGDGKATADALFKQARELVKSGRFEEACPLYARSLELDPSAATRLNLADCAEHLGHFARAFVLYSELRDETTVPEPRRTYAAERAAALEKRIGFLTLEAPPPQRVVVGAMEWRRLDRPLAIDPGDYRATIERADGTIEEATVTIRAGERKPLGVSRREPVKGAPAAPAPSLAASPRTPAPPPPRAPAPPPRRDLSGRRALGFAIGGVGLAALGTGIATGIVVANDVAAYQEHCDDTGCDDTGLDAAARGNVLRWISPIAIGIGAAGLGVGAWALLSERSAGPAVIACVYSDGAGLRVKGTF